MEGLELSEELDELVIHITANQGDEYCGPDVHTIDVWGHSFSQKNAVKLGVRAGSEYNEQVYVRIEGVRGGIVRFRSEHAASLVGGEVHIRTFIHEGCLETAIGDRQHCRDGEVFESAFWRVFDSDEEGPSCGEWAF